MRKPSIRGGIRGDTTQQQLDELYGNVPPPEDTPVTPAATSNVVDDRKPTGDMSAFLGNVVSGLAENKTQTQENTTAERMAASTVPVWDDTTGTYVSQQVGTDRVQEEIERQQSLVPDVTITDLQREAETGGPTREEAASWGEKSSRVSSITADQMKKINDDGAAMSKILRNQELQIAYRNKQGEVITDSFGGLVNSTYGIQDRDTASQYAKAIPMATMDSIYEIDRMNLGNQSDRQRLDTEALADYDPEDWDIDEADNAEVPESLKAEELDDSSIQQAFSHYGETGDATSISLLQSQAAAVGRRADEYVIGKAARSEMGKDNIESDAEAAIGYQALQYEIDRGNAKLKRMKNRKSGQEMFFVAFTPDGKDAHMKRQKLMFEMNPNLGNKEHSIKTTMASTPVVAGQYISNFRFIKKGNEFKAQIKGQGVDIGQLFEDYQGSVGRVINEKNHALRKLIDARAQQEVGDTEGPQHYAKMLKVSEADRKETYENFLDDYLQQGYDEQRAEELARQETQRTMELTLRVENRSSELSQARIDSGNAPRYARSNRSISNARTHEMDRDGDNSQKHGIRMVEGFAENARIRVPNLQSSEGLSKVREDATKAAQKLFEIHRKGKGTSSRAKSDTGVLEGLNAWESDDQNGFWTATHNIFFAVTHIKLFGERKYTRETLRDDTVTTSHLKRMMDWDYLDYFSQHADVIMSDLARLGADLNDIVDGKAELPTSQQIVESPDSPMSKLLKRGGWGYYASVADDAYNISMGTPGSTVEMRGMIEIDQNNSNVSIQAAQSGQVDAMSTLAFYVGDNIDFTKWENDPDSYYEILAEDTPEATDISINNEDKRAFWHRIFNAARGKSGENKDDYDKDAGRPLVVEGFYGLPPRANESAARKHLLKYKPLIESDPEFLDLYPNGIGDADLNEDLRIINDNVYKMSLGKIAISKFVNPIAGFMAIDGFRQPKLDTVFGQKLDLGISDLLPAFMVDKLMRELPFNEQLKSAAGYTLSDGTQVPTLEQRKRLDTGERRATITIDQDGNRQVKDISKGMGKTTQDKTTAVLTHAADFGLEVGAILWANQGRSYGRPNISIHDANKLNGVSYLHHRAGYQFATEALLSTPGYFTQVVEQAEEVYTKMRNKGYRAKRKGEKINVGTSPASRHRALFTVFDESYKYAITKANGGYALTKAELDEMPLQEQEKYRARLKALRTKLELAKRAGWSQPGTDRGTVNVSGEDFLLLIDLAADLQGLKTFDFKTMKSSGRGYKAKMVYQAEADRENTAKVVGRGSYWWNNQNAG